MPFRGCRLWSVGDADVALKSLPGCSRARRHAPGKADGLSSQASAGGWSGRLGPLAGGRDGRIQSRDCEHC